MSYVFSKALQSPTGERTPSKWNTPAPEVVRPSNNGVNETNAGPPVVVRKPSLEERPQQQSEEGASRANAFRQPANRSYTVDVSDYGTGPKMGGAFARLQANLEKPEPAEKSSIYSSAYEAYRAKRFQKEHGVAPQSSKPAAAPVGSTFPKLPLNPAGQPSASAKRGMFAKARADTLPAFKSKPPVPAPQKSHEAPTGIRPAMRPTCEVIEDPKPDEMDRWKLKSPKTTKSPAETSINATQAPSETPAKTTSEATNSSLESKENAQVAVKDLQAASTTTETPSGGQEVLVTEGAVEVHKEFIAVNDNCKEDTKPAESIESKETEDAAASSKEGAAEKSQTDSIPIDTTSPKSDEQTVDIKPSENTTSEALDDFAKQVEPEIKAMEEVRASEREQDRASLRKLSDAIDELDNVDFTDVVKLEPAIDEDPFDEHVKEKAEQTTTAETQIMTETVSKTPAAPTSESTVDSTSFDTIPVDKSNNNEVVESLGIQIDAFIQNAKNAAEIPAPLEERVTPESRQDTPVAIKEAPEGVSQETVIQKEEKIAVQENIAENKNAVVDDVVKDSQTTTVENNGEEKLTNEHLPSEIVTSL